MTSHETNIELQHIEEQLADSASKFIAAILRLTRARGARDSDIQRMVSELKACRVVINALGPQLEIEAHGLTADGLYHLWGGTFNEAQEVH